MADYSIAHCCGGCCVLVHTSSQFCSALRGETRRDIMSMCKQTQLTWMCSETGLTLMNLPINRACKAPRGTSLPCARDAENEGETMEDSMACGDLFLPRIQLSQLFSSWQQARCVLLCCVNTCCDLTAWKRHSSPCMWNNRCMVKNQ